MAQAVRRKTIVPKETVSRPPVAHTPVKAFGDAAAKQPKTRTKSNTQIPKALRHDLENALVNLCNIWFDEIKPHLLRNNIKLHVHQEQAGGEGGAMLPQGAPGCSHLDPGAASDHRRQRNATCAYCSSPLRTTSKAQSRRPPPRPLTPPDVTYPNSPNQNNHNIKVIITKSRKRRNYSRKDTQSEGKIRVPRFCHSLGFTQTSPKPCPFKSKAVQHSKPVNSVVTTCSKKDQFTQTDKKPLPPKAFNIPEEIKSAVTVVEKKFVSHNPTDQRKKRKDETPLFKKDLIDILCSEQNKILNVLYKGPSRSDISSTMNLMPETLSENKKCKKKVKPKPWK